MEDLQTAAAVIADTETRIQRRANMLGQHLANLGFDGVKISMECKITLNNDTGQHIRTICGEYSKFVAGNGDASIDGNGGSVSQPSQAATMIPAQPRPSAWSSPNSSF